MYTKLGEGVLTGDIIHQWTIQEYDQHQRGVRWYIIMITAGLLFVVYGLMSNNFLFSLIIILAGIIMFIQSHQSPPQVLFAITELGVVIGHKFYNYSELKSFFIIYQPPEVKNLFFQTASAVHPIVSIPLLDVNPVEIRETLLEFMSEDLDTEKEPLSVTIARRWRMN